MNIYRTDGNYKKSVLILLSIHGKSEAIKILFEAIKVFALANKEGTCDRLPNHNNFQEVLVCSF